MAIKRFDVFQHLLIEDVLEATSELVVHLRNIAGHPNTIRYEFTDTMEREAHRTVLEAWCWARTPLTYVKSAGYGVLVDDEAAYWEAFA